jgi:hypothetical protein
MNQANLFFLDFVLFICSSAPISEFFVKRPAFVDMNRHTTLMNEFFQCRTFKSVFSDLFLTYWTHKEFFSYHVTTL